MGLTVSLLVGAPAIALSQGQPSSQPAAQPAESTGPTPADYAAIGTSPPLFTEPDATPGPASAL